MKRWLLLLWLPTVSYAQCDLELLGIDLAIGMVTVAFNNTDNCGPDPTSLSTIQFGFQALDEDCNAMNIGWDFPSGFSIPADNNHPGWMYSPTTSSSPANWTGLYGDELSPPYYAGDTVSFPIYNPYLEDCSPSQYTSGMWCFMEDNLQYWLDQGLSIQVVIWQISYGPTMYADMGGWAEVGPNGDGSTWGSGEYEDANFEDNWIVVGPCGSPVPAVDTVYIELPPDTLYIYVTDTVVDTLYVQLPPDTTFVWDTVYITLLDTLVVEVDCVTGEECLDIIECPLYVPNAFTPNNDGINDSWFVEAPDDCWDNVDIRVYSRWGALVWHATSVSDGWHGGYEWALVRDDVYTYRFIARNKHTYRWVERLGHVVVLR